MQKWQLHIKNVLTISAVGTLLWIVPPANAQSGQDNNPPPTRSSDASQGELARFDQFLDSHRDVADQLRRDPSLVNNSEYLQSHPDLQTYLQQHPGIRQQITDNPNAFMQREDRFDRREDARDHDRGGNRGELASFDRFLDDHKQISQELRGDPQRIKDQSFLQKYPDLQNYLQEHPAVRQQLNENPNAFMNREYRYDQREAGVQVGRDPDVTRQELANFDRFLDSHQQISQELRGDPARIKDQQFLQKYPELQSYLQQHPAVREEVNENPSRFMYQEHQYDQREADRLGQDNRDADRDRDVARDRDMNQPRNDRDSGRGSGRDSDVNRRELANFDQFLDSHREISEQVQKNPSLVKNQQFLQNHPALQTYLQQHPVVRQQLDQNPNAFMHQEDRYDRREDARNRADNDNRQPSSDRDANRTTDRDRDNRDARNNDRDRDSNRDNSQVARNQDDDRRAQSDRDANNNDRDRSNNRQVGRDGDTTRGELASFDQFLDHHREIAEQLHRDPSLVKNQQFVQTHPALQSYLEAHQNVREEISENPNAFMRQENNFDHREDTLGKDMDGKDGFREFLSGHSDISKELSKKPTLANDQKFLQKHPDFQQYLKAHPAVQTQLTQDPTNFMKSMQQPSASTTGAVKTTTPDPKPKQ